MSHPADPAGQPPEMPVPAAPAAPAPLDPYAPEVNPLPLPSGPVMERPHPLTPVIKGWMGLVAIALAFGRDLLEHLGDHGDENSAPSPEMLGISVIWWLVVGGLLAYLVVTGIIGFLQWRTTRFVIDDEQVRIEHNFIWHNSDKVPFTKIQSVDVVQPFAARLLGLAQLRIDVGSGKAKTIDYLARERAYQMRDYLVVRAHGRTVGVAEHAASAPVADALHDRAEHETVLLTVPPQRLVLAAVLSSNFLVTLLLMLAVVAGVSWFDAGSGAAGLVPLGLALLGVISNHVVKQWNYSLVRSGRALKVSRGMTSLVSQTLPTNRIQGLAVTQHLLWRPFGLYRVQMDVLGYGDATDDQQGGSDILLPAGTWRETAVAIDAVWPGFRLDEVPINRAPRRARWFAPLGWGFMGWGRTDDVMVARSGVLVRRTQVVHHARAQSVALHQGPLQRRLNLASVQVHTSKGPVELVAHEVDEQLARRLVLEEMDLCRAARRRDAELSALDALPLPVAPAPAAPPASAGDPSPAAGAPVTGEQPQD